MGQVVTTVEGFVDLILPKIKEKCLQLEMEHGPLTLDPVRATAILTTEVGEVALAVLGLTGSSRPHTLDQYQMELLEVIAVCIHMLMPTFGAPIEETESTNEVKH